MSLTRLFHLSSPNFVVASVQHEVVLGIYSLEMIFYINDCVSLFSQIPLFVLVENMDCLLFHHIVLFFFYIADSQSLHVEKI